MTDISIPPFPKDLDWEEHSRQLDAWWDRHDLVKALVIDHFPMRRGRQERTANHLARVITEKQIKTLDGLEAWLRQRLENPKLNRHQLAEKDIAFALGLDEHELDRRRYEKELARLQSEQIRIKALIDALPANPSKPGASEGASPEAPEPQAP